MIKINKKKNFLLKLYKINNFKKEENINYINSTKKDVKNLDYFNSSLKSNTNNNNKIKKNISFKNLSKEKITKLPDFWDIKIKNILEKIIILKLKKLDYIKNNNFLEIVKFFNYKNKDCFLKFNNLLSFFNKTKYNINFEFNNKINSLNTLNKDGKSINNKLKQLKKSFDLNKFKINELINKKYCFENKKFQNFDNNKKNSLIIPKIKINNENLNKKSVFNNINTTNNNFLDIKKLERYNNLNHKDVSLSFSSMDDNSSDISDKSVLNKDVSFSNFDKSKLYSKRKVLNELSILDINIFNYNHKNEKLLKNIEKYKNKEIENTKYIIMLEEESKELNHTIILLEKLEKKLKKSFISFIYDEIEFGYDLKNNGIIWLYIELIKLKVYKIEIYPNYLEETFINFLKKLIFKLIIIFKQNILWNNFKLINKNFINKKEEENEILETSFKKPSYFFETEKIKINKNLYSFRKNWKENSRSNLKSTRYICDQNYKFPKIIEKKDKKNFYKLGLKLINNRIRNNKIFNENKNESNFNIKFIDEDNIIHYNNDKSWNKDKKVVIKCIISNNSEIVKIIKKNKNKIKENSIKLLNKFGIEKIIKNISCIHGIIFTSSIYKIK